MLRKTLITLTIALLLGTIYVQPAQAGARVRIDRIYFDSPGSDSGSNSSLNDEWIRLENRGDATKNLSGWTIKDRAGHTYRFGTYYLKPGYTVHVHTGVGSDSGRHRFWDRGWYVWNNTGDKAYLRNSAGSLVDSCEYSGAGDAVWC